MLRVAVFGTHPKQFNGYSKVVYELSKAMAAAHADKVELHVFGFQNFYNHPGHRNDVPPCVHLYDAHAAEVPKAAGFGVSLVKSYVERIKPHVAVVFNDLMVLTSVLNELKGATNRADFKVVAYIDQVYTCQRADFIELVNKQADAAIAFTPEWRECILSQGLKLPCHVLPHGINTQTYFPVPKHLARRFYGLPEKEFLVLNLNRNQPRKRWDTCLQAFAEVVRRLPDAPIKLVIGTDLKGAWDLHELYKRELNKRGVPIELGMARLIVPGHAQMLTDDETNILYNIADVGINTCDGEGFGLCNFEQAAIGIPQIVPRLGGFLHFFNPSITAMVDPVLSIYVDSTRDGVGGEAHLSRSDDYANAIVAYYTDRELLASHGTKARAAILSGFGWDKIADRFMGIIRDVAPAVAATANTALHSLPKLTALIEAISVQDAMHLLGDRSPVIAESATIAPAPAVVASAVASAPVPVAPASDAVAQGSDLALGGQKNKGGGGTRRRFPGARLHSHAELLKLQKRIEELLGNLEGDGGDVTDVTDSDSDPPK